MPNRLNRPNITLGQEHETEPGILKSVSYSVYSYFRAIDKSDDEKMESSQLIKCYCFDYQM